MAVIITWVGSCAASQATLTRAQPRLWPTIVAMARTVASSGYSTAVLMRPVRSLENWASNWLNVSSEKGTRSPFPRRTRGYYNLADLKVWRGAQYVGGLPVLTPR